MQVPKEKRAKDDPVSWDQLKQNYQTASNFENVFFSINKSNFDRHDVSAARLDLVESLKRPPFAVCGEWTGNVSKADEP